MRVVPIDDRSQRCEKGRAGARRGGPADLLAAGDVGLIPLVPLSAVNGPLEPILDQCRERIEHDAPEEERENLRVVTHWFAGLKYNDPRLFERLGGNWEMLKTGSPLLREMFKKARREAQRESAEADIITVLGARFGPEAEALGADLKAITDARLKTTLGFAATCPDLAAFRAQIATPKRGKRKD